MGAVKARSAQLVFAGIVVALLSNAWASAAGNGSPAPVPLEQLRGTVVTVAGDELTLRLRNGRTEIVDIAAAKAAHHTGVLPKGGAIVVYGSRDASGTFHAVSVGHASQNPLDWSPDT